MGRGQAAYGIEHEVALAAEMGRIARHIEAHLFEDLSADAIASACGVSTAHFSRRFRERQGESLMAHVRGRRLTFAAARLVEGDIGLAELALACGFASQSAFTRAFGRAFGVAPGEVKRSGVLPVQRQREPTPMKPILIERVEDSAAFRVAGLSGRFDPSRYGEIAGLWKEATAQLDFPGSASRTATIGAFRDRDRQAQSFEHLAGARVSDDAALPADFQVWTFPASHWRVFRQMLTGEALHLQVMAAQAEIFAGFKSTGPDLQIYPTPFKLEGGWLEHWIRLD